MAELVFNTDTATDNKPVQQAVIKVIGVGGGGCNAINNMIDSSLSGVEFISANTDALSLSMNKAANLLQLGAKLTQGLGAGANPETGRKAAEEAHEEIAKALTGANMVFITTGMGGGTGTGAAPVIAEIAKKMGILTVAVVTRPFSHEGKRIRVAQEGLEILKDQVDSLIVIPNDKLLTVLGDDVTLRDAFKAADDVLCSAVTGIAEIVTCPGLINLDFADVQTVMGITGVAMMGSAMASGEDRARHATEQAISSPLLDDISLDGARGVLVNITTAPGCLKMSEYREVMSIISKYADNDAELKFGTAEDATMDANTIRVTLVATGLQENAQRNNNLGGSIIRRNNNVAEYLSNPNSNNNMGFNIDSVAQSGRSGRSHGVLTAESFRDQATLDSFEIPTAIRRQID